MSNPKIKSQKTVVRRETLGEGEELPCKRKDIIGSKCKAGHVEIWYIEPVLELED